MTSAGNNEELSLRDIQLSSLKILEVIDSICAKEGLRYWLMYGSLIGAVRHHGFIPWDDDLDIGMPRSDYERLLEYFKQHSDELLPLVAIHGDQDVDVPFCICRISNLDYRMIGEYGLDVQNMGTFVDIYPIDGAGSTLAEAEETCSKARDLIMKFCQAGNFKANNLNNGSIKKALKAMRAFTMGGAGCYRERVRQFAVSRQFDSSEYLACLEWPMDYVVYAKSDFVSLIRAPFEDAEFYIPEEYDRILQRQYGDYMALPPEGEQVGHHYYTIIRRAS